MSDNLLPGQIWRDKNDNCAIKIDDVVHKYVTCRDESGDLYVISYKSLRKDYYLDKEEPDWFGFSKDIINSLINTRDFLAIQLSHERKLVTDEQLERACSAFLGPEITVEKLNEKVTLLAKLIPDRIDAEIISTIFHCSIFDAVKALEKYRQENSHSEVA